MIRPLVELLASNPFKALQKHMDQVMVCVDEVEPLLDALLAGDRETLTAVRKRITKAEHQADLLKNELRDHLPRSIFLPVARVDLLRLLHHQDDLADGVEDAAILADIKPLQLPEELHQPLRDFVAGCVAAAHSAREVLGQLHSLLEASFTGPGVQQVVGKIDRIGHLEWEADKAKFSLVRELLNHADAPGGADAVLWMKLLDAFGDIADGAEQVGDHLRLILSK